jgi:hypothetical protein
MKFYRRANHTSWSLLLEGPLLDGILFGASKSSKNNEQLHMWRQSSAIIQIKVIKSPNDCMCVVFFCSPSPTLTCNCLTFLVRGWEVRAVVSRQGNHGSLILMPTITLPDCLSSAVQSTSLFSNTQFLFQTNISSAVGSWRPRLTTICDAFF